MDFLSAVLEFRNMSIENALYSDNCMIRILAIMDRRTGKRTLKKIRESEAYMNEPAWVKQFYARRVEILSKVDCNIN